VLGLVWIEMGAGGLEIRRLAFADGMHMEGMIAGRNAVEESVSERRLAYR
jgi:hypothetical protein